MTCPFTTEQIRAIASEYGTPVYIYNKATITERISELKSFDIIRYAQKANSNLEILRHMRANNVLVDAVTAGEVLRAIRAGYKGGFQRVRDNNNHHHYHDISEIVYTADLFDRDARQIIAEHQLTVNVGSPDMIPQLAEFSPQSQLLLRINPGFGHGHSKKVNTGGETSKHGIWFEDLPQTVRLAHEHGFMIHGLHLHIGSGSDLTHLRKVADALKSFISIVGNEVVTISAGGGLPIPYHERDERINISEYVSIWRNTKEEIQRTIKHEITLEVEPGRFLVAESGVLVGEICSIKRSGSITYYLVDFGFDTLIRPAMYGAYHHISVVNRTNQSGTKQSSFLQTTNVAVAGPLCESCDVFTQGEHGELAPRTLPTASVGDLIVIHDAGAYGAAMSSNYNSRRLAAEVTVENDGKVNLVRRRQPLEDLLRLEEE